jgi:DNA-binding NtrC family response regulator
MQRLVFATGKPRVLFVDDELGVLRALERAFRSEAVEIFTATSASAALALLEEQHVDVVVSDHHLGDGHGVALLARIHSRNPEMALLLLTADTSLDQANASLDAAGISRLLHKPWNDTELRQSVRRALCGRRTLA